MISFLPIIIAILLSFGLPVRADIPIEVQIKGTDGEPITDCSEVVVFLDREDGNSVAGGLKDSYSMDSKDKEFLPGVLPITVGATVTFPNKDNILHNVFSLSKTKSFDLGLYRKGDGKTVRFDKSGLVKVYCNIHENMVGNILVLENPYFQKRKNCQYNLKNIPDGPYILKAWYQFGDMYKKSVSIANNHLVNSGPKNSGPMNGERASKKLKINLTRKKSFSSHKNKWGRSYQKKY